MYNNSYKVKLFSEQISPKLFNGKVIFTEEDKKQSLVVYINDNSNSYLNNLIINSVESIKHISYMIDDFISNKIDNFQSQSSGISDDSGDDMCYEVVCRNLDIDVSEQLIYGLERYIKHNYGKENFRLIGIAHIDLNKQSRKVLYNAIS